MRRDYPAVPRRGRWILPVLLVLFMVGAGADIGLRLWSQARLASDLQISLGLDRRPELRLEGFPFLLQVARGRLQQVRFEAGNVPAEGFRVERVDLTLRDVRFPRRALLTGGTGRARAAEGEGEAEITEGALEAFLQDQGFPVGVEFLGPRVRVSTSVRVGNRRTDARSEARVELDDGTLVFDPRRVEIDGIVGIPPSALAFSVPLPELLPGVSYQDVEVGEGRAVLRLRVQDAVIRIG